MEATRRPVAFRPFQIGRAQSRIRASGHPITLPPPLAALIALSAGNFIFRANRLQNNFSLRPIHRPGYDLSKRGISLGRPGSRLPGIILARKTQSLDLSKMVREKKGACLFSSNRFLSSITRRTNRIPSGKKSTASGLNRSIFEKGFVHFWRAPFLKIALAFFFSRFSALLEENARDKIRSLIGETRYLAMRL